MATLFFASTIAINIILSVADTVSDFDWTALLKQLQYTKALWDDNQINSYVFRITTTGFIPPCAQAPKYVTVENGVLTNVEYDENYITSHDDLNELKCSSSYPINNNHYATIDQYYDQHIQDAATALGTCNTNHSSVIDDICSDSMQFEYNDILYYPTLLQSYGERPLYTLTCLTVIDMNGDTDLTLYDNQCIVCSSNIQDECETNDECCDGICSEPKWDFPWNPSLKACCYDLFTQSQSVYQCGNDNDCCEDYVCDSSNICVEALGTTEIDIDTTEAAVTVCGDNTNSGKHRLIHCTCDTDCCTGFQCKPDKGKCIPHRRSSLVSGVHYISAIVSIAFTVNMCVMFLCCCRNKDKPYKRVLFDLNVLNYTSNEDYTSTEEEV